MGSYDEVGGRICWDLASLSIFFDLREATFSTFPFWSRASVPFRVRNSHNNTLRTLERSLQAAGTDGYADTESGTSHECAVRVPKGFRD